MKVEDCHGCMVDPSYICVWFNKDEVCPCSICLVKIMCRTSCDLFARYRVKIHDFKVTLKKERERNGKKRL